MSKLRMSSTNATMRFLMMMAIAAMTASGCASDDSAGASAGAARQETTKEDPHAVHVDVDADADLDADDHASDKGLRADYCCVFKTNKVVTGCDTYEHRTKIVAGSACYANSGASSSWVLRDGKCNKYQDCLNAGSN